MPGNPVDEAWLIGFYEGEGSCRKRCISFTQKDPWALKKAQAIVGGTLSNNITKDGKLWRLYLYGREASNFILMAYPHLSPRRQRQIDEKYCPLVSKKVFNIRRMDREYIKCADNDRQMRKYYG